MSKGMYNRYAADLSKELFDDVYGDLYLIATKEQNDILIAATKRKEKPHVGEAQETLNGFCHGTISLGSALDFINARKPYFDVKKYRKDAK